MAHTIDIRYQNTQTNCRCYRDKRFPYIICI